MTNQFRLVALLPMKANSSRVPRKNFKDIAGKPLARWILDTLVSIELIDKIVINTDAIEELAEIGIRNGAHNGRVIIRQRPSELCGDTVSMNKIIADDLTFINAENYLMTHTTNPLLSEETVRKAIDTFHDGLCVHDSLFSVNRHQTRFYDRQVKPINHDPDNLVQTQDLEPFFEENSCLYLFSKSSFKSTNARIGQKPMMMEIPKIEAIDIDEPDDWVLAKKLLSTSTL